MVRTYRFRARRGGFGFAADLTGEVVRRGAAAWSGNGALTVHGKVSLALPGAPLYWEDCAWLAFGAALHGPEMMASHPDGLVVEVHELRYPVADYRCEVAALAMSGFLREALGLRGAAPSVSFAEEGGGAPVFDWGAGSVSPPPVVPRLP
ncbi:hypothetical protein [Streptomyces sp. NPDC050145]|uniref:hypothetical protein n=1 Tax=Streptomyces sp. NPDC050145 TaxID=3365602 RepID=UPI003795CD26